MIDPYKREFNVFKDKVASKEYLIEDIKEVEVTEQHEEKIIEEKVIEETEVKSGIFSKKKKKK